MISSLRGTATKVTPGELIVDVQGVGYAVSMPVDMWDEIENGAEVQLFVSSYIREDRFDLFGFLDQNRKTLFENIITLSGIGPKTGLEICAVSQTLLLNAIQSSDVKLLTNIKGVGKKTAEKLLLDLKNLAEKDPTIFGSVTEGTAVTSQTDQDAIDALKSLGYDTGTILTVLKNLPEDLGTTEERVTAALRSL